jgi:hypothetical protein
MRAAPRDGNGRKLGALSMCLCDDHRLARPTRQKGCYPGVQHRSLCWSTVLYQLSVCHFFFFFGLDVLLTLEGVSRNVGLSPNHTQDRTLRSHHFVWTSHVTPWSSSRHFMEPNDSLSSAQGLGLRHCPEQSESSPQPPRLFILPSALWSSNWFVPLRLATENSVLIYCFPCVHSQPAHPIFLDTIIRIVFPTN